MLHQGKNIPKYEGGEQTGISSNQNSSRELLLKVILTNFLNWERISTLWLKPSLVLANSDRQFFLEASETEQKLWRDGRQMIPWLFLPFSGQTLYNITFYKQEYSKAEVKPMVKGNCQRVIKLAWDY